MTGDFGGHVEATVGGEPPENGAAKRGEGGFTGSAAIPHGCGPGLKDFAAGSN